ncbi:MAG: FadR family transcriptional regulator [Firmicutes bacterium]|nr:FadR family transcriptional regulator [Bacillota bacterium]
MQLTRVDFTKKSTHVAEQLLAQIENGGLRVGDRLPSEQVICEEVGVSRTAVREALSALELAGVLERRPGDGTYVRFAAPLAFARAAAMGTLEEGQGAYDAVEARLVVEPGLAEMAAERFTYDDVVKMKSALAGMETAVQVGDVEGYLQSDYDFHEAIARACKNHVLLNTAQQYLAFMKRGLWGYMKAKCFSREGHLEESLDIHRRLLDALSNRDGAAVRQIMVRHFDHIFEGLK